MRPLPGDEARRWFEQAQHDLADARYMAEGGRHNVACFLAQQAAEKALKAVLYAGGAESVWGHSVEALCREAAEDDLDFAAVAPELAPLDQYYIPTRYPNALPGGIPSRAYVAEDARRAIALAERTLALVASKLGPPTSA